MTPKAVFSLLLSVVLTASAIVVLEVMKSTAVGALKSAVAGR